jgi:hypothetical protein
VSHALVGLALPDIHHPFAEDRSIDQGLAPKGCADARIAQADVAQGLVLDEPDPAGADGGDAGVQCLQVQALQVGNITGDGEGDDLALAAGGDLIGGGKAAQDQA